jgi:hypothetical protein
MTKLAVVLVLVAACAKRGTDCAAQRLGAQQAIAIAKREAVHEQERLDAALLHGSNADADRAALATIAARAKLLDAWALAVTQAHPDAIAADAGGADVPSSLVAARTLVIDYVACVN